MAAPPPAATPPPPPPPGRRDILFWSVLVFVCCLSRPPGLVLPGLDDYARAVP
jgi:hypothetical protein